MALGRSFLTALTRASGTITGSVDTDITEGESIRLSSAGYIYYFVGTLTDIYTVLLGADIEATLQNFVHAVNLTGIAGTTYHTDRVAHPHVRAELDSTGLIVTVTARVAGGEGNLLALTDVDTDCTFSGTTLSGGAGSIADAIDEVQAHSQINSEVIAALAYMETGD